MPNDNAKHLLQFVPNNNDPPTISAVRDDLLCAYSHLFSQLQTFLKSLSHDQSFSNDIRAFKRRLVDLNRTEFNQEKNNQEKDS